MTIEQRATLEHLLPICGNSKDGIKSIGRLRRVSKEIKRAIDDIIISSAKFRVSFEARPLLYRSFRQMTPNGRLHELYFRTEPRMFSPNPLEIEISEHSDSVDRFGKLCTKGRLDEALAMIPEMDVGEFNRHGNQPLDFVSEYGTIDLAKKLIAKGADVNQPSRGGQFPISYAFYRERIEMVNFLMDAGCTHPQGATWAEEPLLIILLDSKAALTMIPLMLSKGADPRCCDSSGKTLLHHAKDNHLTLVQDLVNLWKVPVDIKDKQGRTALWYCKGPALIKYFLESGLSPHEKDKTGQTPFTHAISTCAEVKVLPFIHANPLLRDHAEEIFSTLELSWKDKSWNRIYNLLVAHCVDSIPDKLSQIRDFYHRPHSMPLMQARPFFQ